MKGQLHNFSRKPISSPFFGKQISSLERLLYYFTSNNAIKGVITLQITLLLRKTSNAVLAL